MVFQDHSFLISYIVAVTIVAVSSYGGKILGPGRWHVINTDKCENDDQLRYTIKVERRRMNRTHDIFDGYLKLIDQIDNSYGIRISACKFVDGGCKPFQEISDDCLCCFLKEHAEVNFLKVLSLMGVDPVDCPVPPGEYTVKNFTYDCDSLPAEGLYGQYFGEVYIMKDDVKLSCLAITSEFKEK